MKIRRLTREESIDILKKYTETNEIPLDQFNELDPFYSKLRKTLLEIEKRAKSKDLYSNDLSFGCDLYYYLGTCDWFNETLAGDYGFWRYISLKVAPDIVFRRCGLVPEYFYEKTTRMYIPKMWWYIHMSYQGTIDKTYNALRRLNTDYIMQICERTGRNGFYLEVYREIMYRLSIVKENVLNTKVHDANLFRRVMTLNTARMNVYNLIPEGETRQYVKELFDSCGVREEDYE